MKNTYYVALDGEVLCYYRGDPARETIAVNRNDLPAVTWLVANLMNDAYARGRAEAQEDMRAMLGMKQ